MLARGTAATAEVAAPPRVDPKVERLVETWLPLARELEAARPERSRLRSVETQERDLRAEIGGELPDTGARILLGDGTEIAYTRDTRGGSEPVEVVDFEGLYRMALPLLTRAARAKVDAAVPQFTRLLPGAEPTVLHKLTVLPPRAGRLTVVRP